MSKIFQSEQAAREEARRVPYRGLRVRVARSTLGEGGYVLMRILAGERQYRTLSVDGQWERQ